MKRITLMIASIILLCNISFGQRIEWWAGSDPYVTYYDDTKLTFDSGDGRFFGEYELLSDGRTLTYKVTVNTDVEEEEMHEFTIYAQVDEYTTDPAWWDIFYSPYLYVGSKTFTGSFYLDYTSPQAFMANVTCLFVNAPHSTLYLNPTYYPN